MFRRSKRSKKYRVARPLKSGGGITRSKSCAKTPRSKRRSSRSTPIRRRLRSCAHRHPAPAPSSKRRCRTWSRTEMPSSTITSLPKSTRRRSRTSRSSRRMQPTRTSTRLAQLRQAAVVSADSRPSMLPWALLILVLGGGVVALAYWKSVGEPAPVAVTAPVTAPVSVSAPVAAPAPGSASGSASDSASCRTRSCPGTVDRRPTKHHLPSNRGDRHVRGTARAGSSSQAGREGCGCVSTRHRD